MLLFLHKLREVFKHYFEELEEESLRDNFVIAYELLDEVCWAICSSSVCLSAAVKYAGAGLPAWPWIGLEQGTATAGRLAVCCHLLAIVHCWGRSRCKPDACCWARPECWQSTHATDPCTGGIVLGFSLRSTIKPHK